ncbi:class I SAM-dependent DNA methyltransferase [Aquicoccus sp. G2-2]|uniref:class I SAM-dependent DNA methyltransferase n=1 Tax=Aquicoccus sp. G2-2 TaxID=3092120 RepID=UPI002ADF451E|nr:methyltransferase domain-containing protein [Aquicoccus sp. G2-2]MEA1113072.1 methyltransferase domain-containing protein [Aquicoccus sp. G2-2]
MAEKYLDKIYTATTPEAVRDQYNDWAASYDAEIAENGYATPARCAAALARHLSDLTAPVLDFGCGTGLSGLALAAHGFRTIDGVDPAAAMLAQAPKRGLYRNLHEITPGAELTFTPGTYAAIAAIGVIGAGAAPPSVLDQIANALNSGGLLVFSYNDHALADPASTGKRDALLASGTFRQIEETYGDHLPGIDIKSSVYVFEKS